MTSKTTIRIRRTFLTHGNRVVRMHWLIVVTLAWVALPNLPAQSNRPQIYTSNNEKEQIINRSQQHERVQYFVQALTDEIAPYVERHQRDPQWITSRLQMYWKNKYTQVFVNGMDFSHGSGEAPVPTVRFAGSRDWATDYAVPKIEDILPYMDDPRGVYFQNVEKEGKPWEWVHPGETGHVIEHINERILELAKQAAFLYWLSDDQKYARFANDIFMTYMTGMYYRNPPATFENHRNAKLMGLQTFEVIHERIIEPIAICYDFLHSYLIQQGADLEMITAVLKKWIEQEFKYGVPENNWNLMQARYITYLALALEDDADYRDGHGKQYYLNQMLHHNSEKQKAFDDVLEIFDANTAIWPEPAGYSTGVAEDMLEVICLMDRSSKKGLLQQYPLVEQAILSSFQYLFPNGTTVAFGDAKHRPIRMGALELLHSQYRLNNDVSKEAMIANQLIRFIEMGIYDRTQIHSLFDLFMYSDEVVKTSTTDQTSPLATPIFYAPNVSWIAQRNGAGITEGLMVSTNASQGNHSHANGINIELYAKGHVIMPDAAAGKSYWSPDHREYYSRFPAHNTVVVNGQSDYRTMNTDYSFNLLSCYPSANAKSALHGPITYTEVDFVEPSTQASQRRLTSTIRTSHNSGYFVDIFRSTVEASNQKHEYILHGQGKPIRLADTHGNPLLLHPTEELSTTKGDLIGYDYYTEKRSVDYSHSFQATFEVPSINGSTLQTDVWMQGADHRKIFSVLAPPSRAISSRNDPYNLYGKPSPTLLVRQTGEAFTRPFVAVIEAHFTGDSSVIESITPLAPTPSNQELVALDIRSNNETRQVIFSDASDQVNTFPNYTFEGAFGVATYQNDRLATLLLGAGQLFSADGWTITIDRPGSALIEHVKGGICITTKQQIKLSITSDSPKLTTLMDISSGESYQGQIDHSSTNKVVHYVLPSLNHRTLVFR